jgi:transglutaminase-like putative cysteine protease
MLQKPRTAVEHGPVCVNRAGNLMSSTVAETRMPDRTDSSLRLYLSAAEFTDSDHAAVRAKATATVGSASDPVERARLLYRAVRDGIRYDPYIDYTDPETYRASSVLAKGHGFCVGKASLYVALCRACEIPARLGLADVKNHLATPQLLETVGTNVFAYHGYVEIMPGREWLKVTPTFNVSLCEKLGVPPLEFSGDTDALLQPFDASGREFMSYVAQHGTFFDVPVKFLIAEMTRLYPKLCRPGGLRGNMEEEASKR